MLIDWFTVAAQAINFLILVGLLSRFLYKPILHAIDEREKGIATQLAQAEADKANAKPARFSNLKLLSFRGAAALRKRVCGDEAGASMHRGRHKGDFQVTG